MPRKTKSQKDWEAKTGPLRRRISARPDFREIPFPTLLRMAPIHHLLYQDRSADQLGHHAGQMVRRIGMLGNQPWAAEMADSGKRLSHAVKIHIPAYRRELRSLKISKSAERITVDLLGERMIIGEIPVDPLPEIGETRYPVPRNSCSFPWFGPDTRNLHLASEHAEEIKEILDCMQTAGSGMETIGMATAKTERRLTQIRSWMVPAVQGIKREIVLYEACLTMQGRLGKDFLQA